MSLSESLFENLIKETEEKAINIKYLCPKTGLEKLNKQNVFSKFLKNTKNSKKETKTIVDLTETESDPLDPLSTPDFLISDDYLSIGSLHKNRNKKTKANQKLFENTLKINAPNLSTDELENIVFSAKNQKISETKKNQKAKVNTLVKDLVVPPIKIKLGKNKSEVIPITNTSRNSTKNNLQAHQKVKSPRTSELDRLLGANPVLKKSAGSPTLNTNLDKSMKNNKNLPNRLRHTRQQNYSTIDLSETETSFSKKINKEQNHNMKETESLIKISRRSKNLKSAKNIKNTKRFGKSLKISVKRLSLKTIRRMIKTRKTSVNKIKSYPERTPTTPKNTKNTLNSRSSSFSRTSKSSKFSSPIAASSPKSTTNIKRATRSLNLPVQELKRRTSDSPIDQSKLNSKLFFKLNTIPNSVKRKMITRSPRSVVAAKRIKSSPPPKNSPSVSKKTDTSPKKVKIKKPKEKKIDLTHFEKPYITEKFGKQFLKCHVKIGKIKCLDGNVTISDWEAYEEDKIQKRKDKRRSTLNKSVSFLETVEIFGESETEGSEYEDENMENSVNNREENDTNKFSDKKSEDEHTEKHIEQDDENINENEGSSQEENIVTNPDKTNFPVSSENEKNIHKTLQEKDVEGTSNIKNSHTLELEGEKLENVISEDKVLKTPAVQLENKLSDNHSSQLEENSQKEINQAKENNEQKENEEQQNNDAQSELSSSENIEASNSNKELESETKINQTVPEGNDSSIESSKEHSRKIRKRKYYSPLKSDECPRNKSLRVADEKIIRPSIKTLYGYEVIKTEKQQKREETRLKREQEKQEMKEKKARERLEKNEQKKKERQEAKLRKKQEEEEEEEYLVEKIEDRRKRYGKIEYYIKWAGYPQEENTWEPEDNITDKDLILEFEANFKDEDQKAASQCPQENSAKTLDNTKEISSVNEESENTEKQDSKNNDVPVTLNEASENAIDNNSELSAISHQSNSGKPEILNNESENLDAAEQSSEESSEKNVIPNDNESNVEEEILGVKIVENKNEIQKKDNVENDDDEEKKINNNCIENKNSFKEKGTAIELNESNDEDNNSVDDLDNGNNTDLKQSDDKGEDITEEDYVEENLEKKGTKHYEEMEGEDETAEEDEQINSFEKSFEKTGEVDICKKLNNTNEMLENLNNESRELDKKLVENSKNVERKLNNDKSNEKVNEKVKFSDTIPSDSVSNENIENQNTENVTKELVDLESVSSDHSNDFDDTFDDNEVNMDTAKAIEAAIAATSNDDNCNDDYSPNNKKEENTTKSSSSALSDIHTKSTTQTTVSSTLSSTLNSSISLSKIENTVTKTENTVMKTKTTTTTSTPVITSTKGATKTTSVIQTKDSSVKGQTSSTSITKTTTTSSSFRPENDKNKPKPQRNLLGGFTSFLSTFKK
ncbi:SUN domain-containing protein 2-like isoform X2 [Condylostylus longicornis]|uniref:SUN domain-containing protein 2-like isoform X2 n=1 Tax=Condylostylus longicornis TaxID=2530218 RepID=UPI00244DF28B|nr:SUN domain-containing protein 2-like isoform X2 [Condylostylus longicornis]